MWEEHFREGEMFEIVHYCGVSLKAGIHCHLLLELIPISWRKRQLFHWPSDVMPHIFHLTRVFGLKTWELHRIAI
jgi:hypothetical protein